MQKLSLGSMRQVWSKVASLVFSPRFHVSLFKFWPPMVVDTERCARNPKNKVWSKVAWRFGFPHFVWVECYTTCVKQRRPCCETYCRLWSRFVVGCNILFVLVLHLLSLRPSHDFQMFGWLRVVKRRVFCPTKNTAGLNFTSSTQTSQVSVKLFVGAW